MRAYLRAARNRRGRERVRVHVHRRKQGREPLELVFEPVGKAAESLFITEQGLRNRLLALEERLGIELYRKSRGIRRGSPLTAQGQQFLPEAVTFLDRARELVEMFQQSAGHRVIHVAARNPSAIITPKLEIGKPKGSQRIGYITPPGGLRVTEHRPGRTPGRTAG